MSPEDPNNPGLNTKPDFSSVPLPEPSPIKSPYAPVGGTLGDVADDITQNDTNTTNTPPVSEPKDKTPTPSALKEEKDAPQDAPVNSGAKEKKHFNIPKKFIIIGASALSAIILLVIVISIIANLKDIGPGSNGKSGSLFNAKSVFVPFDENKTKYAFFDGKKISKYEYSYVSHFFDGYALVGKSGQYGIIDEAGNMTVDFDKYDSIVEYGGLYGATKDGQNELIDGQGRVIRKYTNEFNDYNEIEPVSRAALTVFPEGDKKYSIYDPRGEKLAEFTSEDSPVISSTNTTNTKSTTAVFYSGGAYIYDDSGKEVQHIERNIARRYLVIDASDDRSIITFSTKPGEIKRLEENNYKYGVLYELIDDDDRYNASIIKGNFNEYDGRICPNLIYETSYSGGESGYLACLKNVATSGRVVEQHQQFINNKGEITKYIINPTSPYSESSIYPLTSDDYVIKEKGGSYSLYVGGKKKTSFNSRNINDNESVMYQLLNNFNNRYVVQMLTVKKYDDKHYESASIDVSFYNRDGSKACTLKGNYGVNTPTIIASSSEDKHSIVQYERLSDIDDNRFRQRIESNDLNIKTQARPSGYLGDALSLVTYGNGLSFVDLAGNGVNNSVLIKDNCEEIDGKRFKSAMNIPYYGYSGKATILSEDVDGEPVFYYINSEKDTANTLNGTSRVDSIKNVDENFMELSPFLGATGVVDKPRELFYAGKPVGVATVGQIIQYVPTDTCLVAYYGSSNSSSDRVTYVISLDGKIIYTDKK